jgi:hypothetical protein
MAFELLALLLFGLLALSYALVTNWMMQRAFTENRDFAKHLLDENRELIRLLAIRGEPGGVQQVIQRQQQTEARQHQPVHPPELVVTPEY